MPFELTFLTILIVGIVLVSIGLMRRIRKFGGVAIGGVYSASRAGITGFGRKLYEDVKESRAGLETAYEAYQDVQEMVRRGEIDEDQAQQILARNKQYVEGTRGLQKGVATLYRGGEEGAGIYGERGGDSYYNHAKELLNLLGLKIGSVDSIRELITGWKERKRRGPV